MSFFQNKNGIILMGLNPLQKAALKTQYLGNISMAINYLLSILNPIM